jgi:uncharacterized protein YdaU (DUF1376 family)
MKRTTTLPYFMVDSGKALANCGGLPLEEVGAMFMLMLHYWEHDCHLPQREWLSRRLRLKGKRAVLFDQVIADFFPDGVNEHLDLCRNQALKIKQINSENAKKGHEKRTAKDEEPEAEADTEALPEELTTTPASTDEPLDF